MTMDSRQSSSATTTDELIAYDQAHSLLRATRSPRPSPRRSTRCNATRDVGGHMHGAGGAAAMAALEAADGAAVKAAAEGTK
jgi:hypothetical protein